MLTDSDPELPSALAYTSAHSLAVLSMNFLGGHIYRYSSVHGHQPMLYSKTFSDDEYSTAVIWFIDLLS